MTRPIEQAPSLLIRRALSRWLEASEDRRLAYREFCLAPTPAGWDAYIEASDSVLQAEGAAHASLMALPPPARRSVFVVNGRFAWLEGGGQGGPSLESADTQGVCTCRNCHGAGRNVYLFRDGIAREGTCFICGGSGRSQLTPPVQPAPTKGIA